MITLDELRSGLLRQTEGYTAAVEEQNVVSAKLWLGAAKDTRASIEIHELAEDRLRRQIGDLAQQRLAASSARAAGALFVATVALVLATVDLIFATYAS